MTMGERVRAGVFAAIAAAALAACGGGGGGGGSGTPPVVPTATPTPNGPPGYVAPAGAITLIPGNGSGNIVSGLMGSSADGVLMVQSPSTPTTPPNGASLAQYAVTASETAAVIPGSVQRMPASASTALAQRIAENRAALAADGLRERAPNDAALRAQLATVRADRTVSTGARRIRAAQGTVGQQRDFKIVTQNIGNTGGCTGGSTSGGTYVCNATITATLEAVGAHGNVWVDNASLATAGEFTNVPGEFQNVAASFDAYYTVETSAFGPAWFPQQQQPVAPTRNGQQCDASGNPLPSSAWVRMDFRGPAGAQSIDIVITDALKGTGEGGYYFIVNEYPQELWNCYPPPKQVSNNTSMIVVAANNYTPAPDLAQFNENFWLNTDVKRTLAHELQHLLHAHDKSIFPFLAGTQQTSDDAFIEEGCSMLAEDLATDPAPGQHIDTPRYTYGFMLEPSLFSLTAFTGYQPSPTSTATNSPYGWYSNTPGSYAHAYLFMRYLYDRFGSGALARIYASTAPGVGPVVAAANNGETFPQLYRDFTIALAAQNTPAAQAPYAFSSAVVLRGSVQVPSRRSSSPVRTLNFGGPQPPETFANNLPSPTNPLAPGATASTFVVDGGTLFLPAVNAAGGAYVSVTGTGVIPGVQGALVQGALPTPTPSAP